MSSDFKNDNKTAFPLRQKILIGLTISVGLFILISYYLQLLDSNKLTGIIFIYSFGVSMSLLVFETLIDLSNNRVFYIWLIIGIIHFSIYLLTKDDLNFQIHRSANFDSNSFLNQYISDTSTSSLKVLLIFLISYKFFNLLMKKITGNNIVNTYRQMSWSHDYVDRKISKWDVIFNILLFVVILISVLIK